MIKPLNVAIMQPTYLPWPGYFSLMCLVDVFVILDDVQFNKRSWQQRNKIKTHNGEYWLSFPVSSKGKYDQIINCVELVDEFQNKAKHLKIIENSYSKTQYFKKIFQKIEKVFKCEHKFLVNLNLALIEMIKGELEIESELILSSKLNIQGKKDDKIYSICKHLCATTYYSPIGSSGYLSKSDLFEKNNIDIKYLNFTPTQYRQSHGDFITYLSIIDLLFNDYYNAKEYIECPKNMMISGD